MQSAPDIVLPLIAHPPWPGGVAPFTQPDRMGLFGALHGLATADVAAARVLEIGMRDGANLLPLASTWPNAAFVGLEPDAGLAELAARRADAAGLERVTIMGGPLAAFWQDGAPELGTFDYVIAHGILSRLPEAERGAFWTFVHKSLRPHGMAMVSFDTWPGHHVLEPIRRLMRYHIARIPEPAERLEQARAIARFHVGRWHQVHGPTRGVLYERVLGEIESLSDQQLLEELLTDEHHPLHLEDVDTEARAHGLTWVANARATEPRLRWISSSARAFLAGIDDMVRQQQYMDFFVDQRFRTSMFCRDDAPLRRNAHVDDFMGFYVTPRADLAPEPEEPEPGQVTTPRLTREARWLLDRVVSKVLAPTRADRIIAMAGSEGFPGEKVEAQIALTELFFADAIELSRRPPPVLPTLPEADTHPLATAYARLMATEGDSHATSLWHRDVQLLPLERRILARCDGTTSADVIVESEGPEAGDALEALHRHGFLRTPPQSLEAHAGPR